MKIENLKDKMEIKNYRQLCKILEIPVQGGNSKMVQIAKLQRYCKVYKNKQKYFIEEIYEIPIDKQFKQIKFNTYDFLDKYIIGYTEENEKFYFDIDDYSKIKDYYWSKNQYGYITHSNSVKFRNFNPNFTSNKQNKILFHRFVKECTDLDLVVDHRNRIRHDNRKNNLRICTRKENSYNCSVPVNHPTGFLGVVKKIKIIKKEYYQATITINKENIILGEFNNIEEAIHERIKAEIKYFGEFSPQKHLLE